MDDYALTKVKPRLDGKGSEFGRMHRELLPPHYYMFDLDKIIISINDKELSFDGEDNLYLEYRHGENGVIDFKALFEVTDETIDFNALLEMKSDNGFTPNNPLDPSQSITRALIKASRLLKTRLFIVYAHNGKQPFTFYEWILNDGEPHTIRVGELKYQDKDVVFAVRKFWKEILEIE